MIDGRGRPLRLADTATGEVRPTAPGPIARMYVCGITPYDATHLGHAATYLAFDLVQRVWRDGGAEVRVRAERHRRGRPAAGAGGSATARTGSRWREAGDRAVPRRHGRAAGAAAGPPGRRGGGDPADRAAGAAAARPPARRITWTKKKTTSTSPSRPRPGVRVRVRAGTRRAMLALSAGAWRRPGPGRARRIRWTRCCGGQPGPASRPGTHRLGPGRPGWHVECAAIALDRLGESFSTCRAAAGTWAFPHHEMSAAHAEVATGSWPFARAYVHAGMVGLDGEKMSKSRGNLVLVSRLREGRH